MLNCKKKEMVYGIIEVMREWYHLELLYGLLSLQNQIRYLYHSIWLQHTVETMLNPPHIFLLICTALQNKNVLNSIGFYC